MEIINLTERNSIMNRFMAELRDKQYQQNRLLFRNNIRRIGEYMAFEISKTFTYKDEEVVTPLGTSNIALPQDDVVVATILRAGLPFHEGFLSVFDHAENATANTRRWASTRSIWQPPALRARH